MNQFNKTLSKKQVIEIVSGAVDECESKNIPRTTLASWLFQKFNIAIKDLAVNMKDGLPYLLIEYKRPDGKIKKYQVSMEKYKDKLEKEAKEYAEKLREKEKEEDLNVQN